MKYRCGHCHFESDRDECSNHSLAVHMKLWVEALRPDDVWHTVEGGPSTEAINRPRLYKCGHCMQIFADHHDACDHQRKTHAYHGWAENLFVEHLDDNGRITWAACDFIGNPDLSKPPMLQAPSSPTTEGRKDDSDKIALELIPPELLFAVGEILSFGARKYSRRNWEAGMKWSRVFGALMRHMWCWWGGAQPTGKNFVFGDMDTETGKSHLWHAGCCLAFLIAYEERRIGTDDRPGTEQPAQKEPPPADWTAVKS